jgi:hypothetical protein
MQTECGKVVQPYTVLWRVDCALEKIMSLLNRVKIGKSWFVPHKGPAGAHSVLRP